MIRRDRNERSDRYDRSVLVRQRRNVRRRVWGSSSAPPSGVTRSGYFSCAVVWTNRRACASNSAVRNDDVPMSMDKTSGDDALPGRRWFTLDNYPTIFPTKCRILRFTDFVFDVPD